MTKFINREITSTKVDSLEIVVENGQATLQPMEQEILVGNVDAETAQKLLIKKHGKPVQVVKVEADTKRYRMPLDKFIELAEIKPEKEDKEVDDSEEEDTESFDTDEQHSSF